MDVITTEELRRMLMFVAEEVVASQELLTRADRDIGDGDHGLGMTRGFTALRDRLGNGDFANIDEMLLAASEVLIRSMGGASGVVFGLLLRPGRREVPLDTLTVPALAGHLARAASEISNRGGAQVGDKTMLDALDPAIRALQRAAGASLPQALAAAASAAKAGAELTRTMRARIGKAATQGDRTIGFPDPGAVSVSIILDAMARWARSRSGHATTHHHSEDTMNNDQLREFNRNRKIYQIAVITRDLERSMRAWVENLGIGPWTVLTFTNETMKYLRVGDELVTEPFKFLIAISWVGDMQFEIIQPVYGPTIYEKFLAEKGEGLHHIKERIDDKDIEAVLSAYRDKGISVLQTGQFHEDVHYYLGTEPKLDFIYELGNCPILDLPADTVRIYPPESAGAGK